MIVIDTSALMAIAKNEPAADACRDALRRETQIVISAGTYVETKIVAAGRGLTAGMQHLLHVVVSEIIPVTPERAEQIAAAYTLWGKGFHRASLNFGDCFAYATAKEFDCPLLFVGNDFSRTDVRPAIPAAPTPM